MEVAYGVDIGSTLSGSFAWIRLPLGDGLMPAGSHDIPALVDALRDDLTSGARVAMGFEAPLFIPVPTDHRRLSKARSGEGSRSFSAPAGSSVTALALHQAAWILARLREACPAHLRLTLDHRRWAGGGPEPLLLWEAFVAGGAHSDAHNRDAATAAIAFRDCRHELEAANAVTADNPLSLIGAVCLWSGWVGSLDALRQPVLVLKPTRPYDGALSVHGDAP